MPHAIKTKDGITVTGIPDDVAPTDQRVKDIVGQMRAEGKLTGVFEQVSPPSVEQAPVVEQQPEQPVDTPPNPLLQGLGQGTAAVGRGLVGGLVNTVGVVSDPMTALLNLVLPPEYQGLPANQGVQALLTKLGVPEAETEAAKIVQAASSGLSGAAGSVGVGKSLVSGAQALGPSVAKGVGEALSSGVPQQLLGGTGAGIGSQVAASMGGGPVAQFGAGMLGGAAGSALGGLKLGPSPTGPKELVKESAGFKTPILTSDVRPPKTFIGKFVQATGEKIPFAGTGGVRANQQAKRIEDVRDLLSQFGADDLASASDDVMRDALSKRAKELDQWTKAKSEVIDALSTPLDPDAMPRPKAAAASTAAGAVSPDATQLNPPEPGQIAGGPYKQLVEPDPKAVGGPPTRLAIGDSVAIKLGSNREVVPYSTQQTGVGALRPPKVEGPKGRSGFSTGAKGTFMGAMPDEGPTPKPEFSEGARGAFGGAMPGGPEVGPPVTFEVPMTNTIKRIDDSIQYLGQLKTAQVNPAIKVLEDYKEAFQGQDLRNVETLRKQLGDAFKAPELTTLRSTTDKVITNIYGAVKADMADYIEKTGGQKALTQWATANKELSKMMEELDLSVLENMLKRGEATPEVVSNMLFSRKRSDVAALYRNLTPDGQASARSAILAKAAEKAGEDLSPDKFANEVKRLGTQTGVFFTGDELKQVEGLVRVLDATKRASQASVMPATGIQAVIPAGAAALASYFGKGLTGFVASMGAMAGAGGMARLYESKAVRNLLMKLPAVKKGGPEETALFKRLLEAAQAVKSTVATNGDPH